MGSGALGIWGLVSALGVHGRGGSSSLNVSRYEIETVFPYPFSEQSWNMVGGESTENGTTFKPKHSVPSGLCMDSPSPMDPQMAEQT